MNSTPRILIVGLGSIGQRHVRNLRQLLGDDVEIWAVRARGLPHVITQTAALDHSQNVEDRYNIRVFTDLPTALNEQPDIVLVTNPTSLHLPVALSAAQAGCHLFIEKPLSHSYQQVADLINTVEAKNLVGMVGYQFRFHPCVKMVKSLLAENAIGNLLAVRMEVGEYLPHWHEYEDYRQSYAARQELGGGVILTQIHEIDMIFDWFGLPRRVFAIGGQLSSLEIDVEDVASILFECSVAGRTLPVHLHMDYLQQPPVRKHHLIGDAGKITIDLLDAAVTLTQAQAGEAKVYSFSDFERNQLFLDELSHFLACVQSGEEPIVDIAAAAASLRMALAARTSLVQKKLIELN